MENIIKLLRERAKSNPKTIVFPEAEDERVQEAVNYIKEAGIAHPILLKSDNISPLKVEEFAHHFYEIRKRKGISLEQAEEVVRQPLYYAAMMVRSGYADGFVAGAVATTSSVARAAIRCLEREEVINLVSSAFIICVPNCEYGERGLFVFADCGIIPKPTAEQLALIAISTARFAKEVLEIEPRVAFLSFSSKGSAEGEEIERIRKALSLAKEKTPTILMDGELQADAAIIPEVARRKVSESMVAGKANVLIFPNLESGNISYKLIERLAKARAIGPIILGTMQSCSDLSRGCGVEDIIDATAVTAIRAHKLSLAYKQDRVSS